MVLHQAFRARLVRKNGIGGEVRHGVTSGASCKTSLNKHVTPHLDRDHNVIKRQSSRGRASFSKDCIIIISIIIIIITIIIIVIIIISISLIIIITVIIIIIMTIISSRSGIVVVVVVAVEVVVVVVVVAV